MKRAFLLSIISCLFALCAVAQAPTIEGKWKTVDEDGNPKSIVRIFKATNGFYYGEVVELVGRPSNTPCKKCEGNLKDKPIVGMRILTDLKKDGEKYVKGKILDPESGKVYHCKAQLEESGSKLRLRGSLDSSGLFGRSQTWLRAQ